MSISAPRRSWRRTVGWRTPGYVTVVASGLRCGAYSEYVQDSYTAHRKEKMQNELSMYRCHTIFNCSRTCPKGLNPAAAIAKMKLELAAE